MLKPEDVAFQEFSARYAEARASAIRPSPAHEPAQPPAPSAAAAAEAAARHLKAQRPAVPSFAEEVRPAGFRAAVQMLFARPQPKSPLAEALERMSGRPDGDAGRSWLKRR